MATFNSAQRLNTTRVLVGVAQDADPQVTLSRLAPDVENELRQIAGALMRREGHGHTLQATALVNEAFVRLAQPDAVPPSGRAHFLALAARIMRRVLIDHARRKGAQKRGGERERVPLHEAVQALRAPDLDVLDLDALLDELDTVDGRMRQVVEMRFFAGMTIDEIAEVLSVSRTTTEDAWYAARAWLRTRLAPTVD